MDDGQGANHLSAASTKTLSVAAANDPPSLDANISLPAFDEDTTPERTVAQLLGSHFSDVDGTLAGAWIPLSGAPNEGTIGQFQYKTSKSGATWRTGCRSCSPAILRLPPTR